MRLTYIISILLLFLNYSLQGQQRVRIPVGSFQKDSTTIIGLGVGISSSRKTIHVKTIGLRFELLGGGPYLLSRNWEDVDPDENKSDKIYGINISPFGTLSQQVIINGISVNVFPTSVGAVNGILVCWPGFSKVERMNGIAISFLANQLQQANGIQIGIDNTVDKKSTGLQIGGGNLSEEHQGLQISLYNEAMSSSFGMQIGVVNVGEHFRGLQIGLVNKSNDFSGLQIGLINVNKKRILPILNW